MIFFFSSRRRHTRSDRDWSQTCALPIWNEIQLSGLDWISFRLANAYGPRNLSGPLPTFYYRLTTSKPCFVMERRRDFMYVDDLIDVVMPAPDGHGRPGPDHRSPGSDGPTKEVLDATPQALQLQ